MTLDSGVLSGLQAVAGKPPIFGPDEILLESSKELLGTILRPDAEGSTKEAKSTASKILVAGSSVPTETFEDINPLRFEELLAETLLMTTRAISLEEDWHALIAQFQRFMLDTWQLQIDFEDAGARFEAEQKYIRARIGEQLRRNKLAFVGEAPPPNQSGAYQSYKLAQTAAAEIGKTSVDRGEWEKQSYQSAYHAAYAASIRAELARELSKLEHEWHSPTCTEGSKDYPGAAKRLFDASSAKRKALIEHRLAVTTEPGSSLNFGERGEKILAHLLSEVRSIEPRLRAIHAGTARLFGTQALPLPTDKGHKASLAGNPLHDAHEFLHSVARRLLAINSHDEAMLASFSVRHDLLGEQHWNDLKSDGSGTFTLTGRLPLGLASLRIRAVRLQAICPSHSIYSATLKVPESGSTRHLTKAGAMGDQVQIKQADVPPMAFPSITSIDAHRAPPWNEGARNAMPQEAPGQKWRLDLSKSTRDLDQLEDLRLDIKLVGLHPWR